MTNKITLNEVIVLGLLAEKPSHGYDLEQIIRERGIRDWVNLGFSSLYYLLDKLYSEGYIQPIGEKGTQPQSRKVFAITNKGLEVCRQAVNEELIRLEPYGSSFLAGLANSSFLEDGRLEERIKDRIRVIESRRQHVVDTRGVQRPVPDFVEMMFDYSITMLEAERDWLMKTIKNKGGSMEKVDFKKELKHLYSPSNKDFSIVKVPEMKYLMVDGAGNPNTVAAYSEAVEALYSVAYTLKFASKNKLGKDYVVMPLEGLWTADDLESFTTKRNKDEWRWTMMIMQPDWVTEEMFKAAIEAVRAKKNPAPAALSKVRLETYEEGLSVQIMHVGSYDDETPTLQRMHSEFMPNNSLAFNGDHHEIYIGDPRKTEPSKLKTVLRQPVKKL